MNIFVTKVKYNLIIFMLAEINHVTHQRYTIYMNPENLDRIMFVHEKLFLLNFKIDWD